MFFIERANRWALGRHLRRHAGHVAVRQPRKLVEIRIPGGKPGTDGGKALVELAGLAGPDLMLLVTTGGRDWTTQKSSWVQALDGAGVWVEAAARGRGAFPDWLRARAVSRRRAAGRCRRGTAGAADRGQPAGGRAGIAEAVAGRHHAGRCSGGAGQQFAEQPLRRDAAGRGRAASGIRRVHCGCWRASGPRMSSPTLVLWSLWQELRALWLTLVPGAPLPGVWSRNSNHMARRRHALRSRWAARSSRAWTTRMAEADRIVKGRQRGNAWDALALLVAEFAGGRAVLAGRRGQHERNARAGQRPAGHLRRHLRSGAQRPYAHAPSNCAKHCAWREVRFLPTGNPPHRDQTQASAEQRLALVRAAVADEPGFTVDDRETRRGGLSYSVDTLAELRAEYPQRSICLLLGMDAFLGLPNWHRWREILELAHVIVAHRPGWKAPTQGPLGEVMVDRGTGSVRELHEATAGQGVRACRDPAGNLLHRAAAIDRAGPRSSLSRAGQRLQAAGARQDGRLSANDRSPVSMSPAGSRPPPARRSSRPSWPPSTT